MHSTHFINGYMTSDKGPALKIVREKERDRVRERKR